VNLTDADQPRWRLKARCRGSIAANALSYGDDADQVRMKELWCDYCPVRGQCLDHALEHKERDGVWGGATEDQREKMIRRRTPHCVRCGRPLTRVEVIDNWAVAAKVCGEH